MKWHKIDIQKLPDDMLKLPQDGLIVLLLTQNKKMTILGKCFGWKFYDLDGDKITHSLGWFAFLDPFNINLPTENYNEVEKKK